MKKTPKVTVIIPCFNRDKYIADAIESVISQSYTNIELVIVDDGSTDNSRSVIENYSDRSKILEHPGRNNCGQSASINLALRSTKGKYVAILDSDDIWHPNKLTEQVEYLETHQEIGVVFGNGEAIDQNGHHLYNIYERQPPGDGSPSSLLLNCYIHLPSNSLIRRKIFDQIGGFDESLRAAQDHDMIVRVAEVSKIAYLDRKLYKYRQHGESISSIHAELRWRGGFKILKKAAARYPYPNNIIRKRKAVLNFRLSSCKVKSGNYLRASWHLVVAFLCDPIRSLRYIVGLENLKK